MKLTRWLSLGSIAAIGMIVMSGCGGSSPEGATPARGGESAPAPTQVGIDDKLPRAGLEELASVSDLVVRGRVVGSKPGLELVKDDPAAKYTSFTIQVDEAVKGGRPTRVDVALLTEVGGAPIQVEGRPSVKPGDEAIWLLTRIAPEFGFDGYVLTNQQSILPVNGTVVTTASSDTPLAREVAELKSTDRVLARLR